MRTDANPEEWNIILWVNGITTGLSLIGELFMIISYFLIPSIRRFSMKLVISLTFSDLGYAIANILTYFNDNETVCVIEGSFRTSSILLGLGWSIIIMNVSYRQIKNHDPEISKTYNSNLVTTLILANIPTVIGLVGHYIGFGPYFGNPFGICCLSPEISDLIMLQSPMWICVAIDFYYAFKVINELKMKYMSKHVIEYKSILIYPMVLVFGWLPVTVNRIVTGIRGSTYFPMLLTHVAAARIQGFLNALIYGKSEFQRIRRHFSSKHNQIHKGSIDAIAKEVYLQTQNFTSV